MIEIARLALIRHSFVELSALRKFLIACKACSLVTYAFFPESDEKSPNYARIPRLMMVSASAGVMRSRSSGMYPRSASFSLTAAGKCTGGGSEAWLRTRLRWLGLRTTGLLDVVGEDFGDVGG